MVFLCAGIWIFRCLGKFQEKSQKIHAPGGTLSQKWGQRAARGPQAPCWCGPTPGRARRPPGWVLPPLVPYQDSYLLSSRGNLTTEVVFPVSVAEPPLPFVLLR